MWAIVSIIDRPQLSRGRVVKFTWFCSVRLLAKSNLALHNSSLLLLGRARPWMDRFEIPGQSSMIDLASNTTDANEEDTGHIGLVWDRGPAGDFVYGNLNELSPVEKKKKYEEFIDFDKQCREKGVLFLKLLFVTNRDSIAKTLGKRCAQKNMAKDLTTWLQACSSRSGEDGTSFAGLEAISAHIDPTDFVAFNNYERNLRIFSNFALNTDTEENPWVVVNTGDRYAARKALMRAFRSHLHDFESRGRKCCSPVPKSLPPARTPEIEINDMMKTKFTRSWRHSLLAWITLMVLLLLAYIYAENTKWDDTWFHTPRKYNISALLEDGMEDDIKLGPAVDVADIPVKKTKTSKEEKVAPTEDGPSDVLVADDIDAVSGEDIDEEEAGNKTIASEGKKNRELLPDAILKTGD
mmetsp:Transcript_11893/g.21446  ORF Transcript_11893/g.21446 Transcript_11893/m.21446 type:complete len:409 (-) Transcript_11893:271-1497(-)